MNPIIVRYIFAFFSVNFFIIIKTIKKKTRTKKKLQQAKELLTRIVDYLLKIFEKHEKWKKKKLKNIFFFLFTSRHSSWCPNSCGYQKKMRVNLCSSLSCCVVRLMPVYLEFPCLNKARISSKVLFFVSGTFLYVNIQNIASITLNGRNV